MKLTPKQKIFVNEYLVDLNATRAYKVAYKSCKKDETARVNGSKLLTKTNIRDYIDERMKDREKRTEITQDKVLNELSKIAFANGSDFAKVVQKSYMKPKLDAEGHLLGEEEIFYNDVEIVLTDDLPEDKRKAIASIKQGNNGIEIKTNDKVKALELIGKHLGMFADSIKLKGDANTEITIKIGGEDYGD